MTKTIAWGCLLACLALPVAAQDEGSEDAADAAVAEEAVAPDAATEAAATEEPPAADAAPADEIAAEPAVIDDGSEPAAEDSSAAEDTASSDSYGEDSASEDASEDEGGGMGLNLYVGVEFDQAKVDIDDEALQAELGGQDRFDAEFYKLRLGARLFDGVGVEFQAGVPASDGSDDELEVKQFYGLYLVPTGVVLETVEISARLGYAFVELENELGSQDTDGASFGLAAELPLRVFGDGMPNLRFGVGATVYQEERSGRMYGFHGGLRYDFSL